MPGAKPGTLERLFFSGTPEALNPLTGRNLRMPGRPYSKSAGNYKPQFTLSDLEQKDRSFASELTNPLLLRLFLELYNGKGLSKKIKDIQIWPLWLRSSEERNPGSAGFLLTLVEQMFETGNPELDLDSLYDHPMLKPIVRQLDISSPYRRLLSQGILSQYFKDGFLVITFTVEATYHYILSRFLLEKAGEDPANYLLNVLKQKSGLRGIKEAAGICLSEAAVTGDLSLLRCFTADGDGHPDVGAAALAKALKLGDEAEIINELADESVSNCIDLLIASDYILERNLQTEVRYKAFCALDAVVERSSVPAEKRLNELLYYCRISHEHGRYEQALELAKKLSAFISVKGSNRPYAHCPYREQACCCIQEADASGR